MQAHSSESAALTKATAKLPARLAAVGLFLGLFSGLAPAALAQSPDARAMLVQMASAIRSLDYQGSFIYQHAGRVDTLRVFHAGGVLERERLISLNGPRSEVIRNGLDVTCIQANGSSTVYASSSGRGLLPLVPDAGSRLLGDHYTVDVVGTDRVAGYLANIIDVVPRDGYRYGYRLWLDQGSHLLLRSMVTDSERRPLEQFMFVSLEIGKRPSDTDLIPSQRELLTTTAAPPGEVDLRGAPAWSVREPPPGFTFSSARRSREAGKGAEHLVYSDGMASVSIYVEPRDQGESGISTMAGRGTLNVLTYIDGDWRFTVLGDVPAATVSAFARSLERNVAASPQGR